MPLPHLLLSIRYSEVIACTHICWDSAVTSFPMYINSFFSHIPERILKIQGNWRYLLFMYIALGNPEYLGNSLALVYFCYSIQQCPLLLMWNIPNIHLIQTSVPHQGKKYPEYLGKSPKSSSEMAKFATSTQEIPKSLGQSLCLCMLIEEINQEFHIAFSATYGDV